MTARKLVATVSLIVLALILASCGGGATSTPTIVPPTQPPATEVATEDAPPAFTATEESAPTEEAVATDEVVVETESTLEATEAAVEGSSVSADGVTLTVTQENTALRSGPGTTYEVVTRVTVNDVFPVVAQYGEGRSLWYQVTLADGTGAWAWSRVVVLTPADAVIPVAEEVPPAPAS